jgi:hypothetical protein
LSPTSGSVTFRHGTPRDSQKSFSHGATERRAGGGRGGRRAHHGRAAAAAAAVIIGWDVLPLSQQLTAAIVLLAAG